jgi:phage-related protein
LTKIGTGWVDVNADFSPFWRQVEREMTKLDGVGKRVGKSLSNSIGDGIDDRALTRGLDRARSSLSGLDRDSRRASKGFAGLAASMGGGSGGINRAARALDDFGGASNGATATIGGFRIAIGAIVPVLVGFSGAAVAAASSLGPLIGLAAGAGNALASAGQGMGVFALASAGISDALKEQTNAQGAAGAAAASSAGQQRAAARAIQSAQDGVRQATEALTTAQDEAKDAQEDLSTARTEARRALVDMRSSLKDAMLTEQSAILSLRDAKRELLELTSGATPADLAEAQGGVADAASSLTSAQLDVNDAIRELAAVNGDATATDDDRIRATNNVARAQNALAAAQRDVTESQKALNDLQAGPSEDEKARAILAVAEAEQSVAQAKRDRIRQEKALADAEKAGVDGSEQVVAAKQAIADAEKAVSDAQRDVARSQQALSDAQLSANEDMVKGAAAAANLNEKMNGLPPAAQAFVRELIAMKPKLDELRATAASGFFPGATAGLKTAMGSFDSIKKVVGETATVLGEAARKSGELVGSPAFGKDIETIGGNNAKVIETLGEALRHVISALRHVMVAAGPLTQWLADVANKWALNAANAAKAGRETGRMADFFESTRAIAQRLGSIIGHLAAGLLGVGKAGKTSGDQIWVSIDRAAKRFDTWANSSKGQAQLHEFFRRSKDLAGALVPVFANVTKAVALLSLKVLPLTTVLRVLGPYADEATVAFVAYKLAVIATGLATKLASAAVVAHNALLAIQSVNMVRWRILLAAAAIQSGVMTAAQWLLNAALTANPIGIIVLALTALVGGLIYAWKNSETFREVVTGVWDAIKGAVGAAIRFIVPIITGAWNAIKSATSTVWGAISGTLGGIWNAIKSAASTVFNAIASVVSGVWDGMKSAATTVWNGIKSVATTIWNGVKNAIVDPVRDAVEWVIDKISDFSERVQRGFGKIVGFAKDLGSSIKDAVTDGIKGGLNLVIDFLNTIIGVINKLPFVDIGKIGKLGEGDARDAPSRGGPNGDGTTKGLYQGGLVDQPMVMVGEEAPRHPEFVIPTNPAYRGRAIALTQSLMRELGMGGMPGFKTGGILGALTGGAASLWDLAEGSVGAITGKLPGVDKLPGYLKSLGSGVLKSAVNWIKDKIGGLFDGGGTDPMSRLGAMMKRATDIASKGYPYSYGGGHNGSFAPSGDIRPGRDAFGYDCSGYVSAILNAGKLLGSPMSTDGLKVFGDSGNGDYVTIGVRGSSGLNAHTMMQLAGRYFESGSGHGAKQVSGWSGDFPIHRHPVGLAMGGIVQEALAEAMDPERVGWGLARGGILPYRGEFHTGGIVSGPVGQPASITALGGEALVPDGSGLIDELRALKAEIRVMNRSGMPGVMNGIADHMTNRVGQESSRRRQMGGNPSIIATNP